MKNLNTITLTICMLIFCHLYLNAQTINPPFGTNTWYGFNTSDGSQTYSSKCASMVDVDNDGDSDVVCSKFFGGFMGSSNGFVVMKNNGSGFFTSVPQHYPSPETSEFLCAAKLNNDNYADMIVSNTGDNQDGNFISVYFNQGNGNFGAPSSYTVGEGPIGIAADDFNGDNKIDIAVVNYGYIGQGSTVSVLLNKGDGTMGAAATYAAGNSPYRIAAGKINGDNFPDIAIANENGKLNVLMNSGTGTFSNKTEYSFTLTGPGFQPSIKLSDIDNDSDLDILYGINWLNVGNAPAVAILKNSGGTFSSPQLIPTTNFASGIRSIRTADLNSDGWPDIITANPSGRTADGYHIIMSNGSGGFNPAFRNNAGQNTADVMTGDADNDGKIDILTSDSYSMQVTVHKNLGSGIFPEAELYPAGNSIAGHIDAADIDNDNDLDIIVSASGIAATGVPVRVLKNLGNGNFDAGVTYSIRGGGIRAKFRDLNGDNKPDILFATAISSPPYDFHYAINNGDGTFGTVQTKSVGSCGWYDIEAVDMDNDNVKDVIITEWLGCPSVPLSARRIFICLNDGNAGFQDPIIKVVGPHPSPIGTGDFNRDGKSDIVTGVSGAAIEINLGIGNGDLMPPVSYSIGTQGGAYDIAVEDFNADGKIDIASCNQWAGTTMSVLYGNGDGTFQPALILPSAYSSDLANVSGIEAGDLDNDNDLDIIVGNNASNCFSLYYNNNGTFEYKMRTGGYSGVYSPVFADFDGDNKGDLLATGSIPPSGLQSNIMFIKGVNTGSLLLALNLKALIQGFYNETTDKMVKDTARIYLRNSSSPYTIVDSAKSILDSNGSGIFSFSHAVNSVPYYIVIKHRNGLETWNASGQSFISGNLNYNFTTASSQAYGNNQILKGSKFCVYSGDINQDGTIDLTDMVSIFNASKILLTGYVMEDCNGDSFVDLTDMLLAYNNVTGFVNMRRP